MQGNFYVYKKSAAIFYTNNIIIQGSKEIDNTIRTLIKKGIANGINVVTFMLYYDNSNSTATAIDTRDSNNNQKLK